MDKQQRINTYLEEHHQITESGIGLAKLFLKEGRPKKAMAALKKCCDSLDEITIKYCPATARMSGLTPRKL